MHIFIWLLIIDIILIIPMWIFPALVFVVKKIPPLYGFMPSAFSWWIFVIVREEYLNNERTLRHELKHFTDCRLFTPIVYFALYGIFWLYTFIRYGNLGMMYEGSNPFETRAMKAELKKCKQRYIIIR